VVQPAVQIVNSATGPDELRIFYADADAQARVSEKVPALPTAGVTGLRVDEAAQFQNGDRIVLVHVDRDGLPNPRGAPVVTPNGTVTQDSDGAVIANLAQYDTCVLQITGIVQNPAPTEDVITVSEAPPWGAAGNPHCAAASVVGAVDDETQSTMIYLFVGSAYRVDPSNDIARRQLSVLQRSPTGGLIANDWQDLGIGFTDFQVASRWFDAVPTAITHGAACDQTVADPSNVDDTNDSDNDGRREWYSGNHQSVLTTAYTPVVCPALFPIQQKLFLTEITISLALRTSRPVEGIASGSTPAFIDTARVDNGQVGDHPAFDLAGTPDASRPDELKGNNVYRYTTVRVDVRNIGVGL
jgi:hypothetical protein